MVTPLKTLKQGEHTVQQTKYVHISADYIRELLLCLLSQLSKDSADKIINFHEGFRDSKSPVDEPIDLRQNFKGHIMPTCRLEWRLISELIC